MIRSKKLFVISAIFLLLFLVIGQVLAATSPGLGVADSFVVLGSTAVTNNPNSVIIGDVGLSLPGASSDMTGITQAQVNGTIYVTSAGTITGEVVDPPLLVNAQIANLAAYNALSAAPNVDCTEDFGPVIEELSGKILVPGIYCADGFILSTSVPLILDNSDDPQGVWIFRTTLEAAALVTTPNVGASVQFADENVNSSCNVWWKVASSATIGAGTAFIGNILAYQSISLGEGASLEGRAFSQIAAVTLDQNTITYPICVFPPPAPRPTTNVPELPETGSGTFILNELSPWSLLLFGGVFTSAILFGVLSWRKTDRRKK